MSTSRMSRHYDAVLFDLLSALLDSWSLWDDLAGDSALGRQWRMHYLEATSNTERYRPYVPLVAESAKAVGVPWSKAKSLASRWDELKPWPEARDVVAEIVRKTKIGVVTNCSEALGQEAARSLGVEFDVVVTAERAGFYKPDGRITSVRSGKSTRRRSVYCTLPVLLLTFAGPPLSECPFTGTIGSV